MGSRPNFFLNLIATTIVSTVVSIVSHYVFSYLEDQRTSTEAAAKATAYQTVQADPAGCSRGIAEAANLCSALARYDLASQKLIAWAEPVDQPSVQTVLATIRSSFLMSNSSPSWVSPLDWTEEAALRRARALEAADNNLKNKTDDAEKRALSAKLADILQKTLLQDTNAP